MFGQAFCGNLGTGTNLILVLSLFVADPVASTPLFGGPSISQPNFGFGSFIAQPPTPGKIPE